MRIPAPISIVPTVFLAACGGGADRARIRGDFADTAATPTRVVALEAARDAQVKRGVFDLRGLAPGPATLRLLRGADTAGTVAIGSVPAGASLVLHGLRVDPASGRAFPRTVELAGTELVLVNGLRMSRDAGIPADVDARGVVLSLADARDALIVRPDDAGLPDLRVVVGLATRTVTADGDPVDPATLARGDSLRVKGRADHGFVVAERITVPRRAAADGAERDVQPIGAQAPPPPAAAPAPVAAADRPARGRGHRPKHRKRFLFF